MPTRALTLLLAGCLLAATTAAQAAGPGRPSLAVAVSHWIDNEGVEVARRHFAAVYPSRGEDFLVDTRQFAELVRIYQRTGETEAAETVAAMATLVSRSLAGRRIHEESIDTSAEVERAVLQQQATMGAAESELSN